MIVPLARRRAEVRERPFCAAPQERATPHIDIDDVRSADLQVRVRRAKRHFRLTPAGAKQLRAARDAFMKMWAGAERLMPKVRR